MNKSWGVRRGKTRYTGGRWVADSLRLLRGEGTEPSQNWDWRSVAHPLNRWERQGRGRCSQSSRFSRSTMRKLPIISFCVLGAEAARSDLQRQRPKEWWIGRGWRRSENLWQVETELKAEAMDSWWNQFTVVCTHSAALLLPRGCLPRMVFTHLTLYLYP